MGLNRSLKDRIYVKSIPVPESGCWIWLGAKQTNGYGHMGYMGKTYLAHRVSYEQHVGSIPENLVIDHMCRVRDCVNPDHLRATTFIDNLFAPNSMSISAVMKRKTVCPKCGGAYTKVKRGRECVPCRNARRKVRMAMGLGRRDDA